jgi:hypothetical protein
MGRTVLFFLLGLPVACAGSVQRSSDHADAGSTAPPADMQPTGERGSDGHVAQTDGLLVRDSSSDAADPPPDARPSDARPSDAPPSDAPPSDAPPPDAAPPLQERCEVPGRAPETLPASLGGGVTVRATPEAFGFCVKDEASPGQAFGDDECAKIGPRFRWMKRGTDAAAGEAAKTIFDPDEHQRGSVYLVSPPKPYTGPGSEEGMFVAQSDTISISADTARVGGMSTYTPDCISNANLICTRDAQRALVIDSEGADRSIAGAFDTARNEYVLVYSRDDTIYQVRISPYGSQAVSPVAIAKLSNPWGEGAKLRMAVTKSSNTLVIWQEPADSSAHEYFKRYTLVDSAGATLVEPRDYLPFGCLNSRGQHIVSYDGRNDRLLVAANCSTPDDNSGKTWLFVQVYDAKLPALTALGPRKQIDSKYDESWGFQSSDSLFIVHSDHDDRYLLLDDGELLLLDRDGDVRNHQRAPTPARIWAMASNEDAGGYRVSYGSRNGGFTRAFNARGEPVGQPVQWNWRTSDYDWSRLTYLPQSTPGAFAGKYLAATDAVQLFLNDDGSTCYPTRARAFPDDAGRGLVIANSNTGGFARFFLREDTGLSMRVFLSNGDAF